MGMLHRQKPQPKSIRAALKPISAPMPIRRCAMPRISRPTMASKNRIATPQWGKTARSRPHRVHGFTSVPGNSGARRGARYESPGTSGPGAPAA
jgi:hypothetical protein